MKRVAIQGIQTSFHHKAAENFFRNKVEISILECISFKDLVKSVAGSDADFGVIAIENSIAGAILPNYKLITKHNLKIIGEIYLPVHIHLLALYETKINQINEVWSHPMALLQCEDFLDENYQWNAIKKDDTASCAKLIKQKSLTNVAVLASEESAKEFDLQILAKEVQNKSESFTRFFIVAKNAEEFEKANKASLYFTLEHKKGRLVSLLDKMARMNLNLTKIQSIPIAENFNEYSFYVDVTYDDIENFNSLLCHLDGITSTLEVLGKYAECSVI